MGQRQTRDWYTKDLRQCCHGGSSPEISVTQAGGMLRHCSLAVIAGLALVACAAAQLSTGGHQEHARADRWPALTRVRR